MFSEEHGIAETVGDRGRPDVTAHVEHADLIGFLRDVTQDLDKKDAIYSVLVASARPKKSS